MPKITNLNTLSEYPYLGWVFAGCIKTDTNGLATVKVKGLQSGDESVFKRAIVLSSVVASTAGADTFVSHLVLAGTIWNNSTKTHDFQFEAIDASLAPVAGTLMTYWIYIGRDKNVNIGVTTLNSGSETEIYETVSSV